MKKILDIGCGPYKIENAVGLDCIAMEGVDVVHDLEVFPYPLEDNTFDEIRGQHLIEHIKDLPNFIKEVCRIAKPGAKIIFRTPHASCTYASWGDPTHIRPFTSQTFKYFEEGNIRSYYSNIRLKITTVKLHYICYNGERGNSRVPSWVYKPLARLASKNLLFCERIRSNWVGGFEELYVELEVNK